MYWLMKTEPEEYSFEMLVADGRTEWDGIKNAAALKNMRAMRVGDSVFVYHTGKTRSIIGTAKVVSEPYTDADGRWMIDIKPSTRLKRPVSLKEIKATPEFEAWELVRLPRLSVMPVPAAIWKAVHSMAQQ